MRLFTIIFGIIIFTVVSCDSDQFESASVSSEPDNETIIDEEKAESAIEFEPIFKERGESAEDSVMEEMEEMVDMEEMAKMREKGEKGEKGEMREIVDLEAIEEMNVDVAGARVMEEMVDMEAIEEMEERGERGEIREGGRAELRLPSSEESLEMIVGESGSEESDSGFVTSSPETEFTTLEPVRAPLTEDTHKNIVPVYYGTDRKKAKLGDDLQYYTGDVGDFEYGLTYVSIPPDHETGELERPLTIFSIEFPEHPSKHVVLIKEPEVFTKEAFFKHLHDSTTDRADGIFLFIHGFNVKYVDSILRTGQLVYDLNIDSTAVTYSWSSYGDETAYLADSDNNLRTVDKLEEFIQDLHEQSGARKFHVVAHSMGSRAFSFALKKLFSRYKKQFLNQVILAAPDIDAETFKKDIAPNIIGSARRITLYSSSKDKALILSQEIHHGKPRAGQSGESLIRVRGIDAIDATDSSSDWLSAFEIGHSYYGDSLLSDIKQLIELNRSPILRPPLIKAKTIDNNSNPFWTWP